MKWFTGIVCTLFLTAPAFAEKTYSPQEAQEELKQGNSRYMTGKSSHVRIDPVSRERTALFGQKPLATILGCSDARVPPEIVFDQGFGELFVVRVAGNVCSTAELASVEYGVKYLKTPLVVVLGHTHCGAVQAALGNAELKGSLPKLIAMITPAVADAKAKAPKAVADKLLNASIEANVRKTMKDILTNSPGLDEMVRNNKVALVGAIRDIEHGGIVWLKP